MPGYHIRVIAMEAFAGFDCGFCYLVSTRQQELASYEWWMQAGSIRFPLTQAWRAGTIMDFVRAKGLSVPSRIWDDDDFYGLCALLPGADIDVLYYFRNYVGTVDCYLQRVGFAIDRFLWFTCCDISDPADWYLAADYEFVRPVDCWVRSSYARARL